MLSDIPSQLITPRDQFSDAGKFLNIMSNGISPRSINIPQEPVKSSSNNSNAENMPYSETQIKAQQQENIFGSDKDKLVEQMLNERRKNREYDLPTFEDRPLQRRASPNFPVTITKDYIEGLRERLNQNLQSN